MDSCTHSSPSIVDEKKEFINPKKFFRINLVQLNQPYDVIVIVVIYIFILMKYESNITIDNQSPIDTGSVKMLD